MENKKIQKQERYKFFAEKKIDNTLSSCEFCFANKRISEDRILSMGTSTALILPYHRKDGE